MLLVAESHAFTAQGLQSVKLSSFALLPQLAEKRARDEAEAAEKSGKVELRAVLKPKIDSWAAGKKDNIRALLASLHTVLWDGSGWVAPSMADMVDNHKVGACHHLNCLGRCPCLRCHICTTVLVPGPHSLL